MNILKRLSKLEKQIYQISPDKEGVKINITTYGITDPLCQYIQKHGLSKNVSVVPYENFSFTNR